MSPRLASVALALSVLAIAGCGSASPVTPGPTGAPGQPTFGPTQLPAFESPDAAPTDDQLGDVDGVQEGAPELRIESRGAEGVQVTALDPTAKAWRITVTGRDGLDRLELVVETADVAPGVRVDEIVGGVLVTSDDLTRMPNDPTVAAGGCHATLGVCWSSDAIRLPRDGDGRLVAVLAFRDPTLQFSISAASAIWPAEPFVPGPWRESLPFRSWAS